MVGTKVLGLFVVLAGTPFVTPTAAADPPCSISEGCPPDAQACLQGGPQCRIDLLPNELDACLFIPAASPGGIQYFRENNCVAPGECIDAAEECKHEDSPGQGHENGQGHEQNGH